MRISLVAYALVFNPHKENNSHTDRKNSLNPFLGSWDFRTDTSAENSR